MTGRADAIAIVEWFADMTVDPPEVDGYDALDWLNATSENDAETAARVRSLAFVYDQPLNRNQPFPFTGRGVAKLLRGES